MDNSLVKEHFTSSGLCSMIPVLVNFLVAMIKKLPDKSTLRKELYFGIHFENTVHHCSEYMAAGV